MFKKLNIPVRDQFIVADLYEGKNMKQVLLCLLSLKRTYGIADISEGEIEEQERKEKEEAKKKKVTELDVGPTTY
eukprot:TRINITY_DN6766_c0_g1_i1.p1 TRINITY_DN6766_c0_g1~~TRINITY_DN6766_c0_g1_i1.p1  ORF type:complete len:75 (+),score=16.01 TRINITY_DN6766_c0_g1_i1:405-629(+)